MINVVLTALLILLPQITYTLSLKKMFARKDQETVIRTYNKIADNSTLYIDARTGSVQLKPGQELKITALKKGTEEDLPLTSIDSNIDGSTITIKTQEQNKDVETSIDYTITVPSNVKKIIITNQSGDINVNAIGCPVHITADNSNIAITNAVDSITIKLQKGHISIDQKTIPATATVFVEAMHAPVSLSLPRKINAKINARTLKGKVTSEIPITLEPRTVPLNAQTWERFKREAMGTFGNGGAPITIDVAKGNIEIKEKK